MITEIELSPDISEIKRKSETINRVADEINARTKEWQSWRSHDTSYALTAGLYDWRNSLNRKFPEEVIKYIKTTPATYDLNSIKPSGIESDNEIKGAFEYGFLVSADGETIRIDYKTEGIMAVADERVTEAKIEIIDSETPPLLHFPIGHSLLLSGRVPRFGHLANVYARWQPEITTTPRLIKIPDTLELTWEFYNPELAHTYTETEVLSS